MNNNFTPEQSLQVIQNMILRTRTNFQETNKYFILWGVVISLACLLEYIMYEHTDFEYYYTPWIILPIIGWIGSIRMGMRQEKKQSTILGDTLRWIWIGFGIGFIIVFVISWINAVNPSALMMLLSAMGTFITSRILKSTPYLLGSIVLFAASFACLYITGIDSLLLVAAAMILGYIAPAIAEKRA